MYVQREDCAKGLVRLLSIALRIITLLEYVVRRKLKERGEEISGLYAGNPKRSTSKPTSERILDGFKEITLSVVKTGKEVIFHVTHLNELQRFILSLIGVTDGYHTIPPISFSHEDMSEP